jgi:hypothetical protein
MMRQQAQKYYRQFPLYQDANGCGRLFVSLVPSEGEELKLQLHIDPRLHTILGEKPLVIADWLRSLSAVTITSTANILVVQISAPQINMKQIIKDFSEQFDVQLAHAFQINFFAYLAVRPFLREEYWADKEPRIFEDAAPELHRQAEELDKLEQASRERSDSPDSVTVVGELNRLRAKKAGGCLEPWRREKVATPTPVDDSVFIWKQGL